MKYYWRTRALPEMNVGVGGAFPLAGAIALRQSGARSAPLRIPTVTTTTQCGNCAKAGQPKSESSVSYLFLYRYLQHPVLYDTAGAEEVADYPSEAPTTLADPSAPSISEPRRRHHIHAPRSHICHTHNSDSSILRKEQSCP